MKRFFMFILFSVWVLGSQAQEKVTWTTTYNEKTAELEIKATIASGWHMYSQHIKNDIGPVPTEFVLKASEGVKLIGEVVEPAPIRKYDENFEATLDFFETEVVFKQKVGPKSRGTVNGSIVFMVCNESMCLPPTEVTFSTPIP